MAIHYPRLAAFSAAYLQGLTEAVRSHPEEYSRGMVASVTGGEVAPELGVEAVHRNMIAAVRNGTYNHNGRGFKNACKALGIKHTRKAIEAFLKGE